MCISRGRCMCGPEHVLSQQGNIAGTIGIEAEMQAQIRDHLHRHTYTLSHSKLPTATREVSSCSLTGIDPACEASKSVSRLSASRSREALPLESRALAASCPDKTSKACTVARVGLSISMSSKAFAREPKNSAASSWFPGCCRDEYAAPTARLGWSAVDGTGEK